VCRPAAECCIRWQCCIDTALMPGLYVAAVGSPGSPPLLIAVTCGAAWVPCIRHAVDIILVTVDHMLGNRHLQLLAPTGESPVLGPTAVAAPLYMDTDWNGIVGICCERNNTVRGPNGTKTVVVQILHTRNQQRWGLTEGCNGITRTFHRQSSSSVAFAPLSCWVQLQSSVVRHGATIAMRL
jgi:hypothetical protein